MTESNVEYLRRRAIEELQRAEETEDAVAAAIHSRLAVLYADRLASLAEYPHFDPIVQARPTV